MFALLGDTELNVPVYLAALTGTEAATYAEHAVIEGKPLLQWLGDGAEEVQLEVILNAALCDPAAELRSLRGMKAAHKAYPLTFGDGLFKGRYAITRLEMTAEVTDDAGTLLSATLRLTLKEHVEPPRIETVKNPPGVAASGPKPAAKPAAPRSPEYRKETVTNADGFPVEKIVRSR